MSSFRSFSQLNIVKLTQQSVFCACSNFFTSLSCYIPLLILPSPSFRLPFNENHQAHFQFLVLEIKLVNAACKSLHIAFLL